MPSREETHYFGAGPAPLPTPILEEASKVLLNYKDLGYGIAEMSHRSSQANEVLADAKNALAELLDVPMDEYEILFLQGGGSGEFSAVVYHMVSVWVERRRQELQRSMEGRSEEEVFEALREVVQKRLRMDYLVTGSWSLKASQEAARLMGEEHVHVAVDAREANGGKFGMIPKENTWKVDKQEMPALTYYCDNETVDGVEFEEYPPVLNSSGPEEDANVVCDMSSNFLSRKVDVKKYSVIFGGAQKNIGVTGVTIVIIRKNLLPPQTQLAPSKLMRRLGLSVGPVVLDFSTIAKNNSLYNTLPIFDVWVAAQVMQSLIKRYGSKKIRGQEEVSNRKAEMLYGTIERYSDIYQVVPHKDSRSRMNICMRIKKGDPDAEKSFLGGAEKRLLFGLKGHRSVGGIRISNYNAVTVEGVEKLVQYLDDFAKQQGANGVNGHA